MSVKGVRFDNVSSGTGFIERVFREEFNTRGAGKLNIKSWGVGITFSTGS